MAMRFYNTKRKQIEEFKSATPGQVRMYNCGPTVYSTPHIGNYRAFLFADTLRRHLENAGHKVHQVMNITDVGHLTVDNAADAQGADKLEEQARKENKDPWQIAAHYTDIFFRERKALKCLEPTHNPKATDHIPEMIQIIQGLIKKGHAYVVNGNVYYAVKSFPHYGELSGNTRDELNAGARIAVLEEKQDPHDFALWKQDAKHIMQWDSPWGRGFPGWHIECSAMAMKYLGETLDIHTGGEDNIFPHHECEIAQSEAYTGKPFSNYWMHTRFLLVNGEKMSKSKGNFFVLDDLTAKGFSLRAIRYAYISVHYRLPMNFTFENLTASTRALERVDEAMNLMRRPSRKEISSELSEKTHQALTLFENEMNDDLNISKALAAFFGWIHDLNRLKTHENDIEMCEKALARFDHWTGALKPWETHTDIPEEVRTFAAEREMARKNKDFKKSDELRAKITAAGYTVKDTPQGPELKKLS